MSRRFIIGIDGGTQSSKVSIFDLSGTVVCQATVELQPIHMPSPGIAEHPDDDLWDSLVKAARMAMEKFPGNLNDIVGVGLGSIRCCRALLRKDGTLAAPVLSWMDLRLARPYEHTDPSVAYVTTATGYITRRFTGSCRDTSANLEGQWPIDKDTWQWIEDPEAFAAFNIPRDMLFELVQPGEILGSVSEETALLTGIPAGLPVAATANDKSVEALGAGLAPGNTALISLGTYIAGMMYGDGNFMNAKTFFPNMAAVPGHFLYESGGIRKGMWMISWFIGTLGPDIVLRALEEGISPEQLIDREAESVPAGCDGLMTVLDWLAPPSQAFKRGLMIGFDGRHTRAHMYRSILEAIALTMKNHLDAMTDELQTGIDAIIVSGGGSNSSLFMQIFADVFGVPAVRNVVNSAAGLGAAICAAVGVGVYPDFHQAVEAMVRIRDTFSPDPDTAMLYSRMNNEVYRDMTLHTDPILKKAHAVFSGSQPHR
jgi:sugar (pentulose or hexulose) kinase